MLHGVTKEITIEVEETGKAATARGDFRVGAETKFKIKRSDFGINYMLSDEPGKGLGDEVTVMIAIEAIRKDKRER
jgi:polyisoprenoid-binding protein YceI